MAFLNVFVAIWSEGGYSLCLITEKRERRGKKKKKKKNLWMNCGNQSAKQNPVKHLNCCFEKTTRIILVRQSNEANVTGKKYSQLFVRNFFY